MATVGLLLEASLSAALLLQIFNADEAATSRMADFLALVSARKNILADLSAVGRALVAEHARHQFFATVTKAGDCLETRRTVARVTLHGAWVSTRKWFFARAFA